MALETEHVLQVYKRNPVVFERGRGCRLFDADGRGYLDLCLASVSRRSGTRNPRLAAAIAEQAATLLHTSNLYFHPLQGEVATRLVGHVGAAARVLLQQRCGGGRGLPEVRAPLLVRAERAASGARRLRSLVPRPDDRRAVGDLGRSLPCAVCAAARRASSSCRRTIRTRSCAAVTESTGGDHPRAAAGRRRRPAVQPADGGCGDGGVPPHGRAPHRR